MLQIKTQILTLMMVINMTSNSSMKNNLLFILFGTSLQTDKGRELVKEFEGDARTIISKLTTTTQHEVVTLTTNITNLSLTDNWKGTTHQFLSHFKE